MSYLFRSVTLILLMALVVRPALGDGPPTARPDSNPLHDKTTTLHPPTAEETATWAKLKQHLLLPKALLEESKSVDRHCCVCRWDNDDGGARAKVGQAKNIDFKGDDGCGRILDLLRAGGLCSQTHTLSPSDPVPKNCPNPLYFEARHGSPQVGESSTFVARSVECVRSCSDSGGTVCSLACMDFGGDRDDLVKWCDWYYFGADGPGGSACRDRKAKYRISANQLHNLADRSDGAYLTPLELTVDCATRECRFTNAISCEGANARCDKIDQGQVISCRTKEGKIEERLKCCCSYQVFDNGKDRMRVPQCYLYEKNPKVGFDFPACQGQESFYDRRKGP